MEPMIRKDILVIGDGCMDKYTYCDTHRLAPEAPVPVLDVVHEDKVPGMAMNVNRNVMSFTDSSDFVTNDNWNEIVKNRYVHTKSNQHFVRIDSGVVSNRIRLDDLCLDHPRGRPVKL